MQIHTLGGVPDLPNLTFEFGARTSRAILDARRVLTVRAADWSALAGRSDLNAILTLRLDHRSFSRLARAHACSPLQDSSYFQNGAQKLTGGFTVPTSPAHRLR